MVAKSMAVVPSTSISIEENRKVFLNRTLMKVLFLFPRQAKNKYTMSARILIVEDHADLRHLIRMMLEFDGYEIYEASDASEGLEMVHRVRPHLLVLDIMLPGGMNGLDLCRLLKTNPALGLPAVVLVTARGQPRDIEAGLAAGADAYLVKPFNSMKLLEIVKRLCEKFAH